MSAAKTVSKRLLIVVERFSVGGQETRIAGAVRVLSSLGWEVHLACGGSLPSAADLPGLQDTHEELPFGPTASSADLCRSVDMLEQLLRELHIDLAHAHPYLALLPAFLATRRVGTPMASTLHGPACFDPVYALLHELCLQYLVLPGTERVYCVSPEMQALSASFVAPETCCVLPNGVDLNRRRPAEVRPEGPWALIGRVDAHKVEGMKDFCSKAAQANVPAVDVFGDGDNRAELESFVRELGGGRRFRMRGAKTDLLTVLAEGYAGVAGMGRVVLEAAAMELPVCLVGYDGTKGILDGESIAKAAWWNFSGRGMDTIPAETLARQMDSARSGGGPRTDLLRSWVEEHHNEDKLWRRYAEQADEVSFRSNRVAAEVDAIFRAMAKEGGCYLHDQELLQHLLGLLSAGPQAGRVQAWIMHSANSALSRHARDSHHRYQAIAETLAHQLPALRAGLDEANRRAVEAERRLEEAGREHDRRLEKAAHEHDRLEEAGREYERRIAQLSAQLDAMVPRGELEELRTALHQHEQRAEKLVVEKQAVENSLATLRRGLSDVFHGAGRLAGLIEEYKTHRTFRLARLVKLTRHSLFAGRLRNRLRFLGRLIRRVLGSKKPLSPMNPLDPLLDEARGLEALAGQAQSEAPPAAPPPQQETHHPQPGGTSVQATTVPYFGIRAPHGRRKVAIFTNQLVDWFDRRPRFGGGERYALTIAQLMRDLRLAVHFFQPASQDFACDYGGFPVTAFRNGEMFSEFGCESCSQFTHLARDFDHVLHNAPEYASGTVREDAILVFHGIWFDHDQAPQYAFRTPQWYQCLERVFRNPQRIVSVDSNSINYVRAHWPELAARMTLIPNTFDRDKFHPEPTRRDSDCVTILLPRRSHVNRGTRLLEDILRNVPHDVRFHWVGEGDPEETQRILQLCGKDGRLSFHAASFDQMPSWYQRADITVIPTTACEGTSYSCIEALACGCAVVATHVGGLTDIVHPDANGLLVDPDAEALAAAINRLIEDPEERRRLQEAGPPSVERLELRYWRRRWTEVLLGSGWTDREHARKLFPEGDLRTKRRAHGPEKASGAAGRMRTGIVTRNAIHGGVETIVGAESRALGAKVIVAGGLEEPQTCPFPYVRADTYERLREELNELDVVLYHWPPRWAVQAIGDSGVASVEFVHRTDTSDGDKSVPDRIVVHSAFLAEFVWRSSGRRCRIIEHPVDGRLFKPQGELGDCIGGLSSYAATKGLDIFLRAWKRICGRFPDLKVRFYGAGPERSDLVRQAGDLGVAAEFLPPSGRPHETLSQYRCIVLPSRIEGLPMAAIEALAMDIPVVASGLPGIAEFNELAKRRGFDPPIDVFAANDPVSMAEKLQEVLSRAGRPKTHPYIRQFYSVEQHVRELRPVLAEARQVHGRERVLPGVPG